MKRQAVLYKSYTRNQPLLINGKDIITILDREETTRKVSNSSSIFKHMDTNHPNYRLP
jgi:hypothetical protein